ncbi:dTDP-4-dehydrorhamnose reductase [Tsuneonella sp. HG249]
MKALITGAGGQVGRDLVASAPPGWELVPLARAGLDLADHEAIRRAVAGHAPDLILNAAAYTAVDRAERDEAAAFAINAEAVGALADAAREAGAHLVQISTDFVFDGTATRAYLPHDLRRPLSAYGRSKAAGEDAAGPNASVVRTSWVYSSTGANFVTTMLRLMSERDEVRVVSDQVAAPTWATALADVLWALGTRQLAGTWHYADGGSASWFDFAVAIEEEARTAGLLDRAVAVVPIAAAEYPTAAPRPAFSLLDSCATHEALGTVPLPWRSNLRRMLSKLV